MATCIKCGAQLPDGATFCNNCGTAQGQQNMQTAQGAGAPKGVLFCLKLLWQQ